MTRKHLLKTNIDNTDLRNELGEKRVEKLERACKELDRALRKAALATLDIEDTLYPVLDELSDNARVAALKTMSHARIVDRLIEWDIDTFTGGFDGPDGSWL